MACSGPALLATTGGGAGAAATPPVAQVGEAAAGSWPGDPQPATVAASAIENPRRRSPSAPFPSCMRVRMFLSRLLTSGGDHDARGDRGMRRLPPLSPVTEEHSGLPTSTWPRHPCAPSAQCMKLRQKPRSTPGTSRLRAAHSLPGGRLNPRFLATLRGHRVPARCGSNRLCFPTSGKGGGRRKAAAGPVSQHQLPALRLHGLASDGEP